MHWAETQVHHTHSTPFLFIAPNLLKTCCLEWKAAGSHFPSKANYSMGHKHWQYWPKEEPVSQRLHKSGRFYDFGLIPFLYCCTLNLLHGHSLFPDHYLLISESVWRLVLFKCTATIWHKTLKQYTRHANKAGWEYTEGGLLHTWIFSG